MNHPGPCRGEESFPSFGGGRIGRGDLSPKEHFVSVSNIISVHPLSGVFHDDTIFKT